MPKVDLEALASTVSDVKIMFDPRDLIADPSLVDDIEFTNMLNVWRPMLEEVEDVIKELKAARKLLEECNTRHPGENNRLAWAMKKYNEVIDAEG